MRPLLAILSLLLAGFATGAHAQNASGDLPDIGNPASAKLSQADEYKIGLMILRGLRERYEQHHHQDEVDDGRARLVPRTRHG